MRRIWQQKWLVMVGALTIFLSIGAVAWAATDSQPAGVGATIAECVGTGEGAAMGLGQGPAADRREAAKERREQRLERQQALFQVLRGEMTAADQVLFDQLVAAAEDKREAVQAAREDLADTLKQLRELTDKYLETDSAGTDG